MKYTDKYDEYFKEYSSKYFSKDFDWKWFKAQSVAESNLKQYAKSPVGACGLMQIMPATWKDIERQLGRASHFDMYDIRDNIEFGIYYDMYLWNNWKSKRPKEDRLKLMFASYNCGLKYPLDAQKLCYKNSIHNGCNIGDSPYCNLYYNIVEYAPDIKRWRSEETLIYVDRIFKFKETL